MSVWIGNTMLLTSEGVYWIVFLLCDNSRKNYRSINYVTTIAFYLQFSNHLQLGLKMQFQVLQKTILIQGLATVNKH